MRRLVKVLIFGLIFILISIFAIFLLTPQVYINKVNYIEVVDEDDNSLYSLINESLSTYTPLEEISDEFKKTIVTIEDKRFYSHNGLDYSRITKSLIENIKHNKIKGNTKRKVFVVEVLDFLSNNLRYNKTKNSKMKYCRILESKSLQYI